MFPFQIDEHGTSGPPLTAGNLEAELPLPSPHAADFKELSRSALAKVSTFHPSALRAGGTPAAQVGSILLFQIRGKASDVLSPDDFQLLCEHLGVASDARMEDFQKDTEYVVELQKPRHTHR